MRLFLGVKISAPLIEELNKWRKKWNMLPVRWIKEQNLHLTLVQPWETESPEAAIAQIEKIEPGFENIFCQFEGIKIQNKMRKGGMIWLQGEPNMGLCTLRDFLIQSFSGNPASNSFLPHITLARFRENDRINIPSLEAKISFREEITAIVLFRSHISGAGSDYEVLRKIRLKADL